MNLPILFHCWPLQSDPAIHVGHELFPLGFSTSNRYQQWIINLTLGGRCTWRGGGLELDLRARHMVISRPYTGVDWRVPELGDALPADHAEDMAEGHWYTVWAFFHPSPRTQEWLLAQEFNGDVAHLVLDDGLFIRMRQGLLAMDRLFKRGALHRDEWTLLALDRLLLTLHTETARRRVCIDPRVNRAMACMQERFSEQLSLQDIARDAHLSVSHLATLFSEQIGVSPMHYLERLRMERAAGLLQFTSNTVKEVALAIGYRDPEHFGQRFKRYSGQSPRDFRRQTAKIHVD